MNINDECVENITMPDGSIWLQLGEIRKYMKGNPPSKYDPFPTDRRKEVRKDRRTFIKLDEIVGVEHSSCDGSVSASVVLRGGVTVDVKTTVSETMEIIQEAMQSIKDKADGIVVGAENLRP